ncbi:hypothetical protein [Coleofasciculus chthonoplastes]|uniref:hypothetical protein n=1 Tax=Coleofasciculus chthonoplastes TaxID=64178 RepID=UPI003300A4D2
MMRNICPKLFGDLPHLRQAHFSHYHISAEKCAIAFTDGEEISTFYPIVNRVDFTRYLFYTRLWVFPDHDVETLHATSLQSSCHRL